MENDEKHIKELEFIQAIINRLSSKSFYIKGWCLTVISLMFVLINKDSLEKSIWFVSMIFLLPITAFWYLDAYYLWQERKYRELYVNVVKKREKHDYTDLLMLDAKKLPKNSKPFIKIVFSQTLLPFYFIPILCLILYIVNRVI